MQNPQGSPPPSAIQDPPGTPRWLRHILVLLVLAMLAVLGSYVILAYKFVPSAWGFVERRHPALDTVGTRAYTATGIPGDPLNLAFVGSEAALVRGMLAAGWFPADPITLHSSLRIAVDSLAHKPYADAPVSHLYVLGHQQDLAFEQAADGDPSRRHHVRFWSTSTRDNLGRSLWIGAATFDTGVGFSHTTGQVTHHIGADVDTERDKLLRDLQGLDPARGMPISVTWIEHFQPELEGRNGGGDRWVTDGRLALLESAESPPGAPAP
jgi:hypothetical protein